MKNIVGISIVLMLFYSCSKVSPQRDKEYSDSILAGTTQGPSISYSGILTDTLLFVYPSSSTNRFIDINNDGTNDFELRFSGSASQAHRITNNSILPLGESYLATPELDNTIADTLSFNGTIDNQLHWVNDTCVLFNYYWDSTGTTGSSGLWDDITDKYIGIKTVVDGHELFGWIRVEIYSGWNLTIIEHACTIGY